MRLLTGLIRPQAGTAQVLGLDCWEQRNDVYQILGYLPGEIGLPVARTAGALLDLLAGMRGLDDRSYERSLVDRFELDLSLDPTQLSTGNRRRLALVAAVQHDPAVILLDEPTGGLDPWMQQRFIEWVLEEKSRGKTILLSSHQFPEVEQTADRIAVLRRGRIATMKTIALLAEHSRSSYQLCFGNAKDAARFGSRYPGARIFGLTVELETEGSVQVLIAALQGLELLSLHERHQGVEAALLQDGPQEDTP